MKRYLAETPFLSIPIQLVHKEQSTEAFHWIGNEELGGTKLFKEDLQQQTVWCEVYSISRQEGIFLSI